MGPNSPTKIFLFLIKQSHMRTINVVHFIFWEVDAYWRETYSRRCQKPKMISHIILQTVHIYSNLSNTLKTGFCQFLPVSGSQYPNFVYPNSFLGQEKATIKISLISPANIEKFNQREL